MKPVQNHDLTPEGQKLVSMFENVKLPDDVLWATQQEMVRLIGQLASELMEQDLADKNKEVSK